MENDIPNVKFDITDGQGNTTHIELSEDADIYELQTEFQRIAIWLGYLQDTVQEIL